MRTEKCSHGVLLATIILLFCSTCYGGNVGRKDSEIGPKDDDCSFSCEDDVQSDKIILIVVGIVVLIVSGFVVWAIGHGKCSGNGDVISGEYPRVAEPVLVPQYPYPPQEDSSTPTTSVNESNNEQSITISEVDGVASVPYHIQDQSTTAGENDIPSYAEANRGSSNISNYVTEEPPPHYYDVQVPGCSPIQNVHDAIPVVPGPVQERNSEPS